MCTAATYLSGDFYMGRTLDYERGVLGAGYGSLFGTKDSVRSTMPSSARPASQTAIRSTTTRSTRRASAWPG